MDIVALMKEALDKLKGGQADAMDPSQFPPNELALGTQMEMEHTDDPEISAEISMDNLSENPTYYTEAKFREEHGKRSQDEVNYREGSSDERCGLCEYYRGTKCAIVEGEIDADYVCDRFEAKKKGGTKSAAYRLGFALAKQGRKMPHFTEQKRPKKVKDIYHALKREHPGMPAEMKARIAARQGKPGKQKQGPPYKGPLSES